MDVVGLAWVGVNVLMVVMVEMATAQENWDFWCAEGGTEC